MYTSHSGGGILNRGRRMRVLLLSNFSCVRQATPYRWGRHCVDRTVQVKRLSYTVGPRRTVSQRFSQLGLLGGPVLYYVIFIIFNYWIMYIFFFFCFFNKKSTNSILKFYSSSFPINNHLYILRAVSMSLFSQFH